MSMKPIAINTVRSPTPRRGVRGTIRASASSDDQEFEHIAVGGVSVVVEFQNRNSRIVGRPDLGPNAIWIQMNNHSGESIENHGDIGVNWKPLIERPHTPVQIKVRR